MGGLCSKVSTIDKSPSDIALGRNQVADHEHRALEGEKQSIEVAATDQLEMQLQQSFSFMESAVPGLAFQGGASPGGDAESRATLQLARSLPSSPKVGLAKARGGTAKVSEVGSILGRASTVGLGKVVEVLDTLGSSVTSLNASSGFVPSSAAKGNKICMLAFEMANTIVRGCNLMCSVSKPSIQHLKEVVFHSEGVQDLISKDVDELFKLAAADKREELEVFTKEVARFGNRCKDPQWHNMDQYFKNLALERIPQHNLKEDVQSVMQQLILCVKDTSELYHELNALDRFQNDHRIKQKKQDGSTSKVAGESLHLLKQELKVQSKRVEDLKEKSFWSMNLEEMMEKLIDIVHFLHLEIYNAFGCADTEEPQEPAKCHNKLGPAGLALHYANIINLIDTMVSEPSPVISHKRDALYRALPPTIKSKLRSKLLSFKVNEELTATQIKAEMEKTLRWLVPFATNTMKAQRGFGWVGDWANKRSGIDYKLSGQVDFTRIETLYHAEKETTEAHILKLVVFLHHLSGKSMDATGDFRYLGKSPILSPAQKGSPILSPTQKGTTITLLPGRMNNSSPVLTQEDQDMLRDVKYTKFIPRISKSQEFDTKPRHNQQRLSKRNSHSPACGNRNINLTFVQSSVIRKSIAPAGM